jgi:hypothetical protein
MQQRQDVLQRGKYYTGTDQTVDNTNVLGGFLVGQTAEFRDVDPVTNIERSGRMVKCMLVRNTSTIALKPGRICKFDVTVATKLKNSDGYTFVVASPGFGVVDEFLPAAGVPVGAVFWVVIGGPSRVSTRAAGDNVALAVGDWLVAAVGTSATNDDGGRVNGADFGGTRGSVSDNTLNRIGKCLSTVLASQANALVDILVCCENNDGA